MRWWSNGPLRSDPLLKAKAVRVGTESSKSRRARRKRPEPSGT